MEDVGHVADISVCLALVVYSVIRQIIVQCIFYVPSSPVKLYYSAGLHLCQARS